MDLHQTSNIFARVISVLENDYMLINVLSFIRCSYHQLLQKYRYSILRLILFVGIRPFLKMWQ